MADKAKPRHGDPEEIHYRPEVIADAIAAKARMEADARFLSGLVNNTTTQGFLIAGARAINGLVSNGAAGDELPVVKSDAKGSAIEWQGTRYPVSHNWADAFNAMIEAKGQGVGLTGIVGQTRDAINQLPPELKALLRKLKGNKGYALTLFS
jgi:hypothetical protein